MMSLTRQLTIMKGMARLRVPLLAMLALAAALMVATGLATAMPSAAQGGDTYVTAGNTTPCGPGAADTPANPTAVINSGHFALFDVYWDNTNDATSGKTLNNNLCPPAVTNSRAGDEEEGITETFTRAASNIDIRETLFHIPTSTEVTFAATTVNGTDDEGNFYPTTFGADQYDFLGNAGDKLWIVSSHDEEHLNPGFSTALLPDDFLEEGNVQFEIEAVRVPGTTVADRGVAYAFDNADGNNNTSREVRWRSDAPHGLIDVPVGNSNTKRYKHLHWAFTKPGIYQIQVHARATPTADYLGRKQIVTVTSEVQLYTFQVGELADLGVTVTADNATPATGSNVVITYTAANSGPDAAGAVKVSARLPSGLTYVSATTANGSYASATGEWTVGGLASGASATLAVTATVGSSAAGDTLTPTAYIRDTGDHPDLDALIGNNHATATLRPGAGANSNPQFRVVRSISENVDAGAPAGAPVAAADADGDSLSYTLSGIHSDSFTVDNQGQIAVSECGVMDYEARAVYPLTLSVRDNKNSAGVADTADDASVGVTVNLTDVVSEPTNPNAPRVTLQPAVTTMTAGEVLTLTAVLSGMPACGMTVDHYWSEQVGEDLNSLGSDHYSKRSAEFGSLSPGTRVYWIAIRNARDSVGRPIANFPDLGASLRVTWVAATPTPTPSQ